MTQDNPKSPDGDGHSGKQPSAEQLQITAAIQSLERYFDSARKNPTQEEQKAHKWAIRTGQGVIIYTLLTIGITVAAIWSAWEARQAVKLTRTNFTAEERPIIWLLSDLGTPTLKQAPNGSFQMVWGWAFTNYGKSPANNVKIVEFYRLGVAAEFKPSRSSAPIGVPQAPNQISTYAAVSDPIAAAEYSSFAAQNHGISISGEITYDDLSGNVYTSLFCIGRLATGAITHEQPTERPISRYLAHFWGGRGDHPTPKTRTHVPISLVKWRIIAFYAERENSAYIPCLRICQDIVSTNATTF